MLKVSRDTRKTIATSLGVSTGKVAQAEYVMKNAPDLWEDVKEGEESIGGAYKKVKKQEKEQKFKANLVAQKQAIENGGWTQERIGKAKGVSQSTVKFMLKFADFPSSVLNAFSTNIFLKEGHARELDQLVHCTNLSSWLTREGAMLEIIENTGVPTAAAGFV